MLEIEEILFDEYKRVDNICRDMFLSQSGVSQYIAKMEEKSPIYGCAGVPSWNTDYRMLKRVRWLRNQIAHNSSATDCSEEDVKWLKEFHNCLLEQKDPLALLEKTNREQSSLPTRCKNRSTSVGKQRAVNNNQLQSKEVTSSKDISVVVTLLIMVFVGLVCIALFLNSR